MGGKNDGNMSPTSAFQKQGAAADFGPRSPSQLHIFMIKITNIVPCLYTVPQSLLAETSVDTVVFWLFGRCIG